MAKTYEFILKFRLPGESGDPADYLDALFEAGCDDATAGVGRRGTIALDFSRDAATADDAIRSALEAVTTAIPGVALVEIGPDLVNLADIADIAGCSRQNIRKYASGEIRGMSSPFPDPVFTGNPSLWRLAEVAAWLQAHTRLHPSQSVLEISSLISRRNLDLQRDRLKHIEAAE